MCNPTSRNQVAREATPIVPTQISEETQSEVLFTHKITRLQTVMAAWLPSETVPGGTVEDVNENVKVANNEPMVHPHTHRPRLTQLCTPEGTHSVAHAAPDLERLDLGLSAIRGKPTQYIRQLKHALGSTMQNTPNIHSTKAPNANSRAFT